MALIRKLVRGILETDTVCLESRHKDVIKFGNGCGETIRKPGNRFAGSDRSE